MSKYSAINKRRKHKCFEIKQKQSDTMWWKDILSIHFFSLSFRIKSFCRGYFFFKSSQRDFPLLYCSIFNTIHTENLNSRKMLSISSYLFYYVFVYFSNIFLLLKKISFFFFLLWHKNDKNIVYLYNILRVSG